jgi:hypothetical protein
LCGIGRDGGIQLAAVLLNDESKNVQLSVSSRKSGNAIQSQGNETVGNFPQIQPAARDGLFHCGSHQSLIFISVVFAKMAVATSKLTIDPRQESKLARANKFLDRL